MIKRNQPIPTIVLTALLAGALPLAAAAAPAVAQIQETVSEEAAAEGAPEEGTAERASEEAATETVLKEGPVELAAWAAQEDTLEEAASEMAPENEAVEAVSEEETSEAAAVEIPEEDARRRRAEERRKEAASKWDGTLRISFESGVEGEDAQMRVMRQGQPWSMLPEPEREGYTFEGWYTAKDGGEKIEEGMPASPAQEGEYALTLYARWEPVVYRISYNLSGCLENNPDNPHTYTIEDEVVLKEPSMPKGFRFMGWFEEEDTARLGQAGALPLNVMSAEGITDYEYEYEYGYDLETVDEEWEEETETEAEAAQEKEPLTVIPEGHTGDIRLYAERKEVHYTVKYDGNGLLSEVPEAMQCIYGELYPLPAYDEIRGWNTRPDGSGVIYQNGQPAINIGIEDGETVTLYAQKLKEDAWFPARNLEVSQIAFENYSHGRANTIDFQPNGDVFAPFTGIITMIDPAWGWVLFQSLNEVCYADGTEDYMTVGFMHDNDVSDLYAGQIIEQGTPFYQQGGMGNGVPSTYGMHVDMCVYRGAVNRVSRYGAGDTFAFDAFYINRNMTPDIGNPGIAIQPVSGDAPANWTNLWRFIG